ncbi:hypothetical protein E2C01_092436 [Portunus trituberculatus]|uniref:Uncharacterized protein n=1 Tax=Portunus trituberculatus TaxID=210409 RepID=A0A5B7JLY9_PORTR|nr:hypothetical protein [Portunus trituberculatus]
MKTTQIAIGAIGAATFGDAAAGESPIGLPPQRLSYLSRTINPMNCT